MKKILFTIALSVFAVTMSAQETKSTTDYIYSSNGFEFKNGFYEECEGLFSKDGKTLVMATKGKDGYIYDNYFYVPYGTEVIASKAFYNVYSLRIYIPSTVKYIAPDAFANYKGDGYRNYIVGISDEAKGANAIRAISVDENEEAEEVARYNIRGQKLNEPEAGINIIQMSDNTAKKVFVR